MQNKVSSTILATAVGHYTSNSPVKAYRVLTVLGVADLRQHRLRRRLHGRGQGIGRVRHVVDAALRLGGLEPNRAQCSRKPPRAPSPTTTIGALMPRQSSSRSSSAQLSVGFRWPSVTVNLQPAKAGQFRPALTERGRLLTASFR